MGGLTDRLINRAGFLEPIANRLQQVTDALLDRDGQPTAVKDFLNGRWLGHPLHPALVSVPIGTWTATFILDMADLCTKSEALEAGADASLLIGTLSAVGAAATGVAQWTDTSGQARRMGMAHALMNTAALALNTWSLLQRRAGKRGSGVALATTAFAIANLSAYVGGELAYTKGIGVNHQIWPEPPADFTPVLDDAALPEGKLTRAKAGEVPVCLLRRDGAITAVAEWCTHLGGPLAEGELDGTIVTCPWHASQFDITTGAVIGSPATTPLRRFETRLRNGKIEVRSEA